MNYRKIIEKNLFEKGLKLDSSLEVYTDDMGITTVGCYALPIDNISILDNGSQNFCADESEYYEFVM